MGITLDQYRKSIGRWKGQKKKRVRPETPTDFDIKVVVMDGITLASPVLRLSSKVTQLFCCHFLSSQPLQMNNFIFVRKLNYLEPLYLIIYKLYSICILFLIKGPTDY